MSAKIGKCSRHPYCDPLRTGCTLGVISHTDCPNWKSEITDEPLEDAQDGVITDNTAITLPWTGEALGLSALEFITAQSKPSLVAIVGPTQSGKTTFLAAMFLLLSAGEKLQEYDFAGSYSLTGWKNIADHLQWKVEHPPTFPPHTSSANGRIPGLLHLSLRNHANPLNDVIFTDAPGEWFSRWAIQKNAPEAEGARWIYDHSDVFIVIADSEELSGANRGLARGKIKDIIDRLSENIGNRRIALVWTKADIAVPSNMKRQIESSFFQKFPNSLTFSVSVLDQQSKASATRPPQLQEVLRVLSWAIRRPKSEIKTALITTILKPEKPLLAFRGR